MKKTLRKADGTRYKSHGRLNKGINSLLENIRIVIESVHNERSCNMESRPTMLFWQIGKMIREHLQTIKNSDRKNKLFGQLSKQLTKDYGDCFNERNLSNMLQFSLAFSDSRTASLLSHNLNWDHFSVLIPIRNPLKRNFYAEMSRMEVWSADELKFHIKDMLFERISRRGNRVASAERRLFEALRGEGNSLNQFIYDDPDSLEI